MPEGVTLLLIAVVIIALAFDYVNGFHDAANAIATVVSTRALSPRQALFMAGCLNFVGAVGHEAVAKTMAQDLIDSSITAGHLEVVLAALVGALLWNLLTWWWGLPSSSSHALVGGLIGAVSYHVGSLQNGAKWHNILMKVVVPGLVAPLLAIVVGYLLMVCILWFLYLIKATPARVNRNFRIMQRVSACLMAYSHGMADAQKVMGIITLALLAAGLHHGEHVPLWVKFSCALMIALGTSAGGWKIIKTMGTKIFKMQPVHGFAADMTSSFLLHTTASMGMPLSTTHVITGSIMGVGASKRVSAVRWGVAKRILGAWVFTIPASALVAACTCAIAERIF
ncbi:inorganic phosphate transporter [bacterium]|nr:inorganic phosphate transporter [bacterium]